MSLVVVLLSILSSPGGLECACSVPALFVVALQGLALRLLACPMECRVFHNWRQVWHKPPVPLTIPGCSSS